MVYGKFPKLFLASQKILKHTHHSCNATGATLHPSQVGAKCREQPLSMGDT